MILGEMQRCSGRFFSALQIGHSADTRAGGEKPTRGIHRSTATYRQEHDVGSLERIIRRKGDAPMVESARKVRVSWATDDKVPIEHIVLRQMERQLK